MQWKIHVPTASDCALATDLPWFRATFVEHVGGLQGVVIVEDPDLANLVVIFERWANKDREWWDEMLHDPFLCEHLDRCHVVSYDDYTAGLMPGCYTSLTSARYSQDWHRACTYPANYIHKPTIESVLQDRKASAHVPKLLYSFRGNLRTNRIRNRLHDVIRNDAAGRSTAVDTKFWAHDESQAVEYIDEMLDSQFVLCPRGLAPATYRVFEAMQAGRCPVIISDDWVPPDGPAWHECSLRVAESEVGAILGILKRESHRSKELGSAARRAWEAHFSERSRFLGYHKAICELSAQRALQPPLTMDALRKRMNSWRFSFHAGWLSPRPLAKRVARRFFDRP